MRDSCEEDFTSATMNYLITMLNALNIEWETS